MSFVSQNQAVYRLKELKSEPNVRALFQQICDLVQREELNAVLTALDLFDSCTVGPSNASGTACADTGGTKETFSYKRIFIFDNERYSDCIS